MVARIVARWAPLAGFALVAGCHDPSGPKSPPDVLGTWTGANAVVALELRLSNRNYGGLCFPERLGYPINVRGTYRDLKSGKSVDICTYTQLSEGYLYFPLFLNDVVVSPSDTVTYVQTTFDATVVDSTTIRAMLRNEYNVEVSPGSWTGVFGDSSAIVLRKSPAS